MISKFKQTITKQKKTQNFISLLNPGNSKSNPLFFPHKFHMDVDKCFISFQVVFQVVFPVGNPSHSQGLAVFCHPKLVGKSNNKGPLKWFLFPRNLYPSPVRFKLGCSFPQMIYFQNCSAQSNNPCRRLELQYKRTVKSDQITFILYSLQLQ